jgi:hypothetical protein
LISSSHSRPRIINDADCNIKPPSVKDFPQPTDLRAEIFVSYVEICKLSSRLCQMLTRKGLQPSEEKDALGLELLNWVNGLPPRLKLVDGKGSSQPYNLQVTQLHVPFLSAITLLYSPRPIFSISPDNTAAVVASTLAFRIYEAFHLRDQLCYLGPIFSWHLLVASVTRLSCLRIPYLREEAQGALDITESFLRELGIKWPSALNNLKNLEILRRDANCGLPTSASHDVAIDRDLLRVIGPLLFKCFGSHATSYFAQVESHLQTVDNDPTISDNPPQEIPAHSQILAHREGETHAGDLNDSRGANVHGSSSLNEVEMVGSVNANPVGDSWHHLDDPFVQDIWTLLDMEQSYAANYLSPNSHL